MAIFAIVFTFATLENAQLSDFHLYITWMVLFGVEVAALVIFRKPITRRLWAAGYCQSSSYCS